MSLQELLYQGHGLGRLVKDQVMAGPGDFDELHLGTGVFD
jgi:hypothetical protein